ncbi:A/G-specific adenine glycosylase [Vagococcus vulneris]|uniref:Adenine DNA glycosylase n=1 Tax=Vagococcus vulneris TaxID=1977869 RepID=A0A429ZZZ7_9ENTE|nr:A/G-specific adenine glycosylase [Vagococcus vulneris]RST99583.1 A/G-specific adenine glycosylase [Vagococcus vulneris]
MSEQKTMWNQSKVEDFQDSLLTWYDQEKRLLPWREDTNPYRVWVSEIMLQQTQVATVIPYFYRFMEWFPTIQELAEAPEEKLLKAWEGLGYYSRVRNMQKAAQMMVEDFGGQMPDTITDIMSLKGIGPYTGGAIASIAFNLAEPAIDGNVMRVYSRLFCIADDIAQAKSRKVFDQVVRETMSQVRPGDFNQALMDLGSNICNPTAPKCDECPLKDYCQAYTEQRQTAFPVKTKKVKAVPVYYIGLVVKNQLGDYYMVQRPSDGLLANLWTFPLVEVSADEYAAMKKAWQVYLKTCQIEEAEITKISLFDRVAEETADDYLLEVNKRLIDNLPKQADVIWQTQPAGEVTHLFSHRKWHILVAYGQSIEENSRLFDLSGTWIAESEFQRYPFPKPQEKMLDILVKKGY